MSLPFEPAPDEDLRDRLPEALGEVYMYPNPGPTRPGTKRQHVFDTEEGVRLIISRGVTSATDDTFLHVSASAFGSLSQKEAAETIFALFGKTLRGRCLGQSDGGTYHFKFRDVQPQDLQDND